MGTVPSRSFGAKELRADCSENVPSVPGFPLVIHVHSASVQMNVQTAIAEPRLLPRQLDQPLAQLFIASPASIPKTRHRNLHQPADSLLARLIISAQPAHFFPQLYEPHPFFEITAFNISLSKLKSATNFFSRWFSSSS